MNCWHCDRPAHGVCRFCGRALCREHIQYHPFILQIYRNDEGVYRALVVAEALYCGVCKPNEEPIDLPKLR